MAMPRTTAGILLGKKQKNGGDSLQFLATDSSATTQPIGYYKAPQSLGDEAF